MARPTWRGVTICDCMKAPLDELAKTSGHDILVSPIAGFGSFQIGQTASAGTGSGGGHVDLALGKLNAEQKLRLEGLARRIGFYADIREPRWWSPTRKKYLSANWASHLHMVLKACGHLSPEAKSQLQEWYAGGNGLVGNDPDDGDRRWMRQTWAQYVAARDKPTTTTTTTTTTQSTVDLASLKFGKTNAQVKLYQAAVWRALSPTARTAILAKHGLKEAQIADGSYGGVTREMTTALYAEIAKREPKGGWPPWREPGPRLLQRLGFIVRAGARDLDGPRDEFGEPAGGPDAADGATRSVEDEEEEDELRFETH